MAFFKTFRRGLTALFGTTQALRLPGEGEMPGTRDTQAVIHDLTRAVRNDPEAVDIYLALGNLFRAQGDIERAVLIREGLIARPGLNISFKARAHFELGQDYRRAGVVDRAVHSFAEASRLGYDDTQVTTELAALNAEAGNFERAAEHYHTLGHSLAQAHYTVRQAEDCAGAGDDARAVRLLTKALKIYSGSVEAWSALLTMAALAREWPKTARYLNDAFVNSAPGLRFSVLETLYTAVVAMHGPEPQQDADNSFAAELNKALMPVLEKQPPQLITHYYEALFRKRAGDIEGATISLSKALVVQPTFWAARLELLGLSAAAEKLPPDIALQIVYFEEQLRHSKRFICSVCGLRQDTIFYHCPRCCGWHSVTFRLTMQE